jgi:4a-hydroxytetrahydrobiopterin dehydratase
MQGSDEVDRLGPERLAKPLIVDVCVDVNDLDTMAPFYERLLGYERRFELPGHVYLVDPSGRGPHVYLQAVPEPRNDKNRLHLDIVVPSLENATAFAIELGATKVDERTTPYTWFVVLADPEGNLFCLVDLERWQATRPPWWQHAPSGAPHDNAG